MKDSLILEGKMYISASRAAKIINYAQDYIGQLCRAGKLECKMVGRSWFVTEASLLAHRENTIDSTPEKVAQIVQNKLEETKLTIKEHTQPELKNEVKKEIPAFNYQAEKSPFLPELKKKVPTHFSLPQNISKSILAFSSPAPILSSPTSATLALPSGKISSRNSLVLALTVVCIAISGLMFGAGFSHFKTTARSNSSVSTPSETSAKGTPTAPAAVFNGIGILSSTSPEADETAKAKIKNSFSDEVTIHPDQSGTAGVIKPVFKKTSGDDFVYVLVPVKEKKQ